MKLQFLEGKFSVCKVADFEGVDLARPFCFAAGTDLERSLVCPTERAPENCVAREDGWRGFRFMGTLEFSLVGILARVSALLAERQIGIFAVSTYDTDYIFLKERDEPAARRALTDGGYEILD